MGVVVTLVISTKALGVWAGVKGLGGRPGGVGAVWEEEAAWDAGVGAAWCGLTTATSILSTAAALHSVPRAPSAITSPCTSVAAPLIPHPPGLVYHPIQLKEGDAIRLDEICRQYRVPLLLARSYGLVGYLRVSIREVGWGQAGERWRQHYWPLLLARSYGLVGYLRVSIRGSGRGGGEVWSPGRPLLLARLYGLVGYLRLVGRGQAGETGRQHRVPLLLARLCGLVGYLWVSNREVGGGMQGSR